MDTEVVFFGGLIIRHIAHIKLRLHMGLEVLYWGIDNQTISLIFLVLFIYFLSFQGKFCVIDFSRTKQTGIMKLGTHMDNGCLYS